MTDKPKRFSDHLTELANWISEEAWWIEQKCPRPSLMESKAQEIRRLAVELLYLESAWSAEHDERVRLEERLKAAEARVEMWERIASQGGYAHDGQAQDPQ